MAQLGLDIVPLEIPTHVTLRLPPGKRENGIQAGPKIAIADLPADVLEALANEFVEAFLAAGSVE